MCVKQTAGEFVFQVKDTMMLWDTKDTSITVLSNSENIYYTLYFLCLLKNQQRVMGSWFAHAWASQLSVCMFVLLILAKDCVGVCIL